MYRRVLEILVPVLGLVICLSVRAKGQDVDLASPPPIGIVNPNTGSFTTLEAQSLSVDHSPGSVHGVYAQPNFLTPQMIRQFVVTDNSNQPSVNAASVFQCIIWDGKHDAPNGNNSFNDRQTAIGVELSCLRHDPKSTGAVIGLSSIAGDDSGSGLLKYPIFVGEEDFNNASGADYVGWDYIGSAPGDMFGLGHLITSVGPKNGGIGLLVRSNVQYGSGGPWERGIVVRDWRQTALHLINNTPGSTGWNLTMEARDINSAASIVWTQGGNAAEDGGAHIKWVEGIVPASGWRSLYDPSVPGGGLNRFTYKPGGESRYASAGISPIMLNMDANSSAAGVWFGSGGPIPTRVAGIDGQGSGIFKALAVDTASVSGALEVGAVAVNGRTVIDTAGNVVTSHLALEGSSRHGVLLSQGVDYVASAQPKDPGQCFVSNGADADPTFRNCPSAPPATSWTMPVTGSQQLSFSVGTNIATEGGV